MAPKRSSHLDEPPAASSSEEQEEVSSEEEEEEDPSEDEEEEDAQNTPEKPSLSSPTKKTKTQPSKDDADSSSDSEPEDSSAVKPIASKPMDAPSTAAKKPRSKPSATPAKRSVDGEASKSSKRSRKKSGGDAEQPDNGVSEDEPKKSGGGGDEKKLFQRLWSEDDEIVILKGMIDYATKKGSFPSGDNMGPFHESIKKSIHVEDFTKSQLVDKVRRLRKKYENNAAKKDYDPSRAHDKKSFELSKKIWGSFSATPKANGVPSSSRSAAIRSAGKTPASTKAEIALPSCDVDSMMLSEALSHFPKSFVKRGLDLVPEDKKAELSAEWEKVHLLEVELFVKKNQLMSEQARLILEALKQG